MSEKGRAIPALAVYFVAVLTPHSRGKKGREQRRIYLSIYVALISPTLYLRDILRGTGSRRLFQSKLVYTGGVFL
jgi:hypothetical protein